MERNQYSTIDGLIQIDFIGNIVIAKFINASPICTFWCCCKPQQKLRLKIVYFLFILIIAA